MGKHNDFGRLGEEMAADFLVRNGYQIMSRNYRYLRAEIDIVAKKNRILAIVEVKSRSSEELQEIAETVNRKKIKLLTTATDHYVEEQDLDVEVRFDIITILKRGKEFEIEHLEDAFYHF